jgi:O-antigen/teichoic acid export membrane protein
MEKPGFSQVFRENTLLFVGMLLSFGGDYLINNYSARLYQPDEYGNFAVFLKALLFMVPIILKGQEEAALRFLPAYEQARDYSHFSSFQKWLWRNFFITSGVILVLGALLVTIDRLVLAPYVKPTLHAAFDAFWVIPFYALMFLQESILRARRHQLQAIYIRSLHTYFATAILLVWATFWGVSNLHQAFISLGVGTIMVVLWQYYLIKKHIPYHKKHNHNKRDQRKWRQVSYQMMLTSLTGMSIVTLDLFMMELIEPEQNLVGHFACIETIACLVFISDAAYMYISPLVAPLVQARAYNRLQKAINQSNWISVAFSGLIVLTIVIWGRAILSLFGPSYVDNYPELVLMTVGNWGIACFAIARALLQYSGQQNTLVWIEIIYIVLLIILDLILIPVIHILGAVTAFIISSIVALTLMVIYVRRRLCVRVLYFV